MTPSTTCRVFDLLARLNGNAEDDQGCLKIPTHRVLMRVEPTSGIQVEVLAEVCWDHWSRLTHYSTFVRYWPIRDHSRPDSAAASLAADS